MQHNTETTMPASVYKPLDAVYNTLDVIDQRLTEKENGRVDGATFNIPELRDYVRPILPGEVALVCGLSRNGKSFLIKKFLYEETMKLMARGVSNKCTVLVTWEESVEMVAASWLAKASGISSTKMLFGGIGRKEYATLEGTVAIKVAQYPIYIIGSSIKRTKDGRRKKPNMTMQGVDEALNWIMNIQGKDPVFIAGDYAQRVPMTGRTELTNHMRSVFQWYSDVAFWAGCPTMWGTQAKQNVGDRQIPMPTLYDSEWSAYAGQSCDHYYGVMMPKNSHNVNDLIDVGPYSHLTVTNTLKILGISKQKGAPDGYLFPLELLPDHLSWRLRPEYFESMLARDMGHRVERLVWC